MILVVGATGILGGMVTRRLLEQGREVRILVREGSDYQSLVEAGAEPVMGDLKDRASLERACTGVDTVITTANSALRGGDDNVQTVEIEGNRNLIDAAKKVEVGHFIFVSALGASEDIPVEFMRGKALAERHLRESGIPYTILAPNVFMEGWIGMIVGGAVQAGQPVTLVGEGSHRHTFVSVEDVAAFAVAAVDNPAAINQYIPIGGPDAVSWMEIVDICSQALGREIPVRHVAPGEPIPGLPEVVAQFMANFENYETPLDMSELTRTYGVTLTSVDDFARRAFGSSAPAA